MQRRKGAERRRGETSLQTSTKKSYPYIELSVQANIDLGDRCSRNSLSLQGVPLLKKRLIGQPQKWRLIHNLSSHRLGRQRSINAGITKEDFPVTFPSSNPAAHVLFCSAPRGFVVWGRDLKAYYRYLMSNPAYGWCTGTMLAEKFYFDCYCPFGARSKPPVFQRLSDAIQVMLR